MSVAASARARTGKDPITSDLSVEHGMDTRIAAPSVGPNTPSNSVVSAIARISKSMAVILLLVTGHLHTAHAPSLPINGQTPNWFRDVEILSCLYWECAFNFSLEQAEDAAWFRHLSAAQTFAGATLLAAVGQAVRD